MANLGNSCVADMKVWNHILLANFTGYGNVVWHYAVGICFREGNP